MGTKLFNLNITNDRSAVIPLILAKGNYANRLFVRLSGGCGYMEKEHTKKMYQIANAFQDIPELLVMGGGTRMLSKDNYKTIIPGITELLPRIKKVNPSAKVIGIVPKIQEYTTQDEMKILPDGRVVFDTPKNNYVTSFMPGLDMIINIQKDVDTGVRRDDEYLTAHYFQSLLAENSNCTPLGVYYNGGSTTQKEIVSNFKRGRKGVLMVGSGRITDEFCVNNDFLHTYQNQVHLCKSSKDLRTTLKSIY